MSGYLVSWRDLSKEKSEEMKNIDSDGKLAAVSKAMAVIEFNLDGTIISANENFLKTLGYTLGEIQNKHHGMFVDDVFRASAEYRDFWAKLNRGEYQTGEYRRVAKDGRDVWIQASYNPILDLSGRPFKVVKYATDITNQKLDNANSAGQIEAVNKAMAVIEFNLDGTIIDANENFLSTLGYALSEIKAKHHGMFVGEAYRTTPEYREFWAKLNRGEYQTGEYRRFGKGGKEVWIQASYNPIMDLRGKPFKVVKYATDITQQKLQGSDFRGQIDAVSKAMAIIEFKLDGTIINANQNFLSTLGYTLDEIKNKHHGMFVDDQFRVSTEYKDFWARLNRGEYQTGEYRRVGRGGKEVWIQASYNPILDMNGNPFKVVKYATDITEQVRMRGVLQTAMSQVVDTSKALSMSADELTANSQEMGNNAEDTAAQANVVSAAAEEVSKNVQTVATGTEEMSASIREIAGNAGEAAKIASQAVNVARNAGDTVSKFGCEFRGNRQSGESN